ncbi:MAG: hypothetical protein Q4C96_04190 [Planctomycetia bacterium]|nr:hypothetical protein [Planctomycetia bacterium]
MKFLEKICRVFAQKWLAVSDMVEAPNGRHAAKGVVGEVAGDVVFVRFLCDETR